DVVPLVLGALQYVLGRKLADVGLRQVLPERILEFEIAGEIDRRRNHLEVLLDGGYAFFCVGLDDPRRRKMFPLPGIGYSVRRIGDDRNAVLARAKPEREIGGLCFAWAVPVDQDRGERRRDRAVDHFASQLRARHYTVVEFSNRLRLLRVRDRLARPVPVLA